MKQSVPKELHIFFWDVDPDKIDVEKSYMYVIERLLDKGNVEAVQWVFKTYSKDKIIETLKKRRDFSPWTAHFWANYLSINKQEILCLQPHYLKLRRMHWQY